MYVYKLSSVNRKVLLQSMDDTKEKISKIVQFLLSF